MKVKTAYDAAYARLIEEYQPSEIRLFDDPLAKMFFINYISFFMQFSFIRKLSTFMYNITSTGIFGLQVCRTRYIDNVLKEAIDDGI